MELTQLVVASVTNNRIQASVITTLSDKASSHSFWAQIDCVVAGEEFIIAAFAARAKRDQVPY